MKNDTYNIKTLEQIISIVTENNVDCFLKDFGGFILTTVEIKKVAKLSGTPEFIWTDDNTPGCTEIRIIRVKK